MNKPLDVILTSRAQQREQDAVTIDADQLFDVAGRLADLWTSLFKEASQLAERRGLTALLTRVAETRGADCARALRSLLEAAGTFQASVTDLPAPEFPTDPIPQSLPENF